MPFLQDRFFIEEPIPAFLFLMREFGLPQAQAQQWIGKGRLFCEGKKVAHGGVRIQGEVVLLRFKSQSKGLRPLFVNKDFILFDKPAPLLVHPNKMSAGYSMLDEIRYIAGDEANAVHRLDMETSGLLLAACHKQSERDLKMIFERRKVQKSYLAWVKGRVDKPFYVDARIAKIDDYSATKHKVKIDASGQEALTRFEPLAYSDAHNSTLLRCIPHTGRTHQIRIHLFHVKHPILGDPIYGTSFEVASRYLDGELTEQERVYHTGARRLMLHAHTLRFSYKNRFFFESKAMFSLDSSGQCVEDSG